MPFTVDSDADIGRICLFRRPARSISIVDKEAWLRIANGFMGLIRRPKPTAQQSFDDDTKDRGTNQEDSKESH